MQPEGSSGRPTPTHIPTDVRRVDIGCGAPEQRFRDCYGVDVNPDYEPDLVWDCNKGLPFADDSLDFINSDNSLEHLWHPAFVLQECYRCLRPGGGMRLIVPNLHYLPTTLLALVYDVDRYFYWYMRLPHKRARGVHQALFTKSLTRRMCKAAGFEIVSSKGFLYSKELAFELRKPPAPEAP